MAVCGKHRLQPFYYLHSRRFLCRACLFFPGPSEICRDHAEAPEEINQPIPTTHLYMHNHEGYLPCALRMPTQTNKVQFLPALWTHPLSSKDVLKGWKIKVTVMSPVQVLRRHICGLFLQSPGSINFPSKDAARDH